MVNSAVSPSPRRRDDPSGGNRPDSGLGGRDFRLLMLATLGTFANYASLLSVVPLWSAVGGAEYGGVGAATGVTMGATVAVQLCMGGLLRRCTLRTLLAWGALLLGLPTFAYPLSSQLAWVLGVSAVRGAGFGMVAVAGSALAAGLVPAKQRGRALGLYGAAVGLPHLILLPLGVWAARELGFFAVFAFTGALCVLTIPLVLAMSVSPSAGDGPGRDPVAGPGHERAGKPVPYRALAVPWLLLLAAACALGGVTSFLPLSLNSPATAPAALSVLFTASVAGRWAAGVWSDRTGPGRLLVPAVVTCGIGMTGFAAVSTSAPAPAGGGTGWPAAAAVFASAALYGLGFGALQNDTLVVMFHRAGPGGHGRASTVWNMAYDGGTGAGSLAVGLFAQWLGFAGAFLASAVAVAVTAPWAVVERRRTSPARRTHEAGVRSRSGRPGTVPARRGACGAGDPGGEEEERVSGG